MVELVDGVVAEQVGVGQDDESAAIADVRLDGVELGEAQHGRPGTDSAFELRVSRVSEHKDVLIGERVGGEQTLTSCRDVATRGAGEPLRLGSTQRQPGSPG